MDGETVGIVGAIAVDPTLPVMGNRLAVGIAAAALTPRLPISVESRGIPAGALVVVDDVDGGADVATPVEPEPHIPDNPAVVANPEVIDNPEAADIPDDIPDAAVVPGVAVAVDAVAGVAAPLSVTPPPS